MSDAIRLIKNRPTAIRTDSDLDLIRKTFDADLLSVDAVWASLSSKQKMTLVKHFEYKAALSEEGDVFLHKRSTNNQECISPGLFILFHGEAVVSTRQHSIVIHGGDGVRVGRAVLGRLDLPEDAHDFFAKVDETMRSENKSLYHKFVSLEEDCKEISIHFQKGASYLMLPQPKSKIFIERLNASLITRRVLRGIGISELLNMNTTNFDDKPKIWRFKPGHVLLKEGSIANRVLFVAKGSCFVFRRAYSKQTSQQLCVGSLASPSFIGFAPLFLDCTIDGNSFGIQPVSIVANSEGYAFSFCSRKFISVLKNTKTDLVNAFNYLAECQRGWTDIDDLECPGGDGDQSEKVNIADEEIRDTAKEDTRDEPASEEMDPDNEKQYSGIDRNDLISNIGSGKLRRSKLLQSLHKSLSSHSQNGSLLRNIDHPLLQSINTHLLKEIMKNLERDCGVIFRRNESDDPFHNFTIESNASKENMTLLIPRPDLDRLHRMGKNFLGLGRKRLPKYDDSDPFLLPVPSAVDRKYHGKTLPIVRRAKGSIDLVNYNEKEWI